MSEDTEVKSKVQEDIDRLVAVQDEEGYQSGWVLHQLQKKHNFCNLTEEDWYYLAKQLGYKRGWASYKIGVFVISC